MIQMTRFRVVLVVLAVLGIAAIAAFQFRRVQRQARLDSALGALKEGRTAEALKQLTPIAASGDALAQEMLGSIYAHGFDVPADDIRAGIWFRRAEWSSRAPGENEYQIGRDFLLGRPPVSRDLARAAFWMERAAQAGHLAAQRILADPAELAKLGLTIDPGVSSYWSRHLRTD